MTVFRIRSLPTSELQFQKHRWSYQSVVCMIVFIIQIANALRVASSTQFLSPLTSRIFSDLYRSGTAQLLSYNMQLIRFAECFILSNHHPSEQPCFSPPYSKMLLDSTFLFHSLRVPPRQAALHSSRKS